MATLWYVKDGNKPTECQGDGVAITMDEILKLFTDYKKIFISEEPPKFNQDSPSMYPRYVVLEIFESDGNPNIFNKAGFYILEGLSPAECAKLLNV